MADTHFDIPEEHRFPVQRTQDGVPYVALEDVARKLGDGIVLRLEEFLRTRTALSIGGKKVACLWDLNDFLKSYVPAGSISKPVKVL